MDVLLFGGTTEGRQLAQWLDARQTCDIIYCTATGYGASLLEEGRRVRLVSGPLSQEEKLGLVEGRELACIVDATHPYARHISESVDELADILGVDVVRVARVDSKNGTWTAVRTAQEAACRLASTEGHVLLTTGTKDLPVFVDAIADFKERLYVRVLPLPVSLERVLEAGIPASHIVAMQGPSSVQLNVSLIRDWEISHMVTKQSGPVGGFDEKVQAARDCGIELVVIERPLQKGAVLLEEAQRLLEERYGL